MIYLPCTDVQGKQGVYYSEDQNMNLCLEKVPKSSYKTSVCSMQGYRRGGQVWLQQIFPFLGIKSRSSIFRRAAVDTGLFGGNHYGQIGSLVVQY